MTEKLPEEIAANFTPAQRKALAYFTDEWVSMWPVSISRRTVMKLVDMGALERKRPTAFGMVKFRLSRALLNHKD